MIHDAIIIGGSFAGLSAAMQLVRARRRVLVIDSGLPRNRFADGAHGFLSQEGRSPLAIRAEALDQLLRYPTATFIEGEAVAVDGEKDDFTVTLADGRSWHAARLILATGIVDDLPALPGIEARWGKTVLHCPYCHGYELGPVPLGVLATHPMSVHQALVVSDWGPTTFFIQDEVEPDAASAAQLAARHIEIERSPIVELLGEAPALEGVRLADGRALPIGGLFLAPGSRPNPLVTAIGCEMEAGAFGSVMRLDGRRETSVPGVYAAGNVASATDNIALAVAAGAIAGGMAHQSLYL